VTPTRQSVKPKRTGQKLAPAAPHASVTHMPLRKAKRLPVRMAVSIGGRAAALSADISEHGFRLETPTLLKRGDAVSGFVLHGDMELNWSGTVSWVRAGNPQQSTWHEAGIEFGQISPGLRALLSIRLRG
jgi:hypothetical protein